MEFFYTVIGGPKQYTINSGHRRMWVVSQGNCIKSNAEEFSVSVGLWLQGYDFNFVRYTDISSYGLRCIRPLLKHEANFDEHFKYHEQKKRPFYFIRFLFLG